MAEEIDQFGRSQARELASWLASVMVHLLKLAASPAAEPRAGWRATIREHNEMKLGASWRTRQACTGLYQRLLPRKWGVPGRGPATSWRIMGSNRASISAELRMTRTRCLATVSRLRPVATDDRIAG